MVKIYLLLDGKNRSPEKITSFSAALYVFKAVINLEAPAIIRKSSAFYTGTSSMLYTSLKWIISNSI